MLFLSLLESHVSVIQTISSLAQSILLPSDETFITPDTDVVFTVFTLTFSGMLDFEFSV